MIVMFANKIILDCSVLKQMEALYEIYFSSILFFLRFTDLKHI